MTRGQLARIPALGVLRPALLVENSTWPGEVRSCAGARAEGQRPYPLRLECVFCPRQGRWLGCASVLREGQSQGGLEGSFFVDAVVLGTSRDACGRTSQASPPKHPLSPVSHTSSLHASPFLMGVPKGSLGSCVQASALQVSDHEAWVHE